MINDRERKLVRENWIRASKDLSFTITTPFSISIKGKEREAFAFLPDYGIRGIVIELTSPPMFDIDKEIIEWARENKYHYSFINIETFLVYNEDTFRETLEDWK